MPVLWHIVLLQTLDISNITSLIMATISAGCSIKPNADGNYSGLQFSHYCFIRHGSGPPGYLLFQACHATTL